MMKNESKNFWQGQRVRLRAMEQADIETMLTAPNEPDFESERADDQIYFPQTMEQHRAGLAKLAKRDGGDGKFFFLLENEKGELIGNAATFDCDQRCGTFSYSIVIERPFWGQGYASEAINLLLRYYFLEQRYQKVTIFVYSFNERSIRLHQKLGFSLEGRLRRMTYTNGRFYDALYFGLTKEEFMQQHPPTSLAETQAS